MTKPTVGFIVGPTASGKTALSINVAKALNAEIISADSIQIYKNLDIGSAKPSLEEREGIVHHLLDFLPAGDTFSVADFQKMALSKIDSIISRGKFPLVVGGTGLYVNSLIYPLKFEESTTDNELRERLNALSNDKLHAMLYEKDQKTALRLHKNDKKRIVRALEIIELSESKTVPDDFENSKNAEIAISPRIIGINQEREVLYDRINKRVDLMMENGLLSEVKSLLESGLTSESQSMQGLGYKQLIKHLSGEYTLEEAVERIKVETRHFAKRQLTWFRRDERIHWLKHDKHDIMLNEALNFLRGE